MSAGTGGSEADPVSYWVGLSLHEFAGLTSSLDAEQTVAVLALCDCSPEPHEPGSDRVVPGKVLLLQSLGWDPTSGAMEAPKAPAAPPWSAPWSCASAQRKCPGQ